MQVLGSGIVVIAISVLLLTQDWRYLAISLGAHYAGIALLVVGRPSIEPLLIEVVLCLTAGALVWLSAPGRSTQKTQRADDAPLSPFFQVLTLILCGVGALGLSNTYTITTSIATNGAASSINFTFFWLTAAGIMALSMTRSPFSIGSGLLFLLEAVQLAYLARVEVTQPAMLFALVVIQLMLIFVIVRFANLDALQKAAGHNAGTNGGKPSPSSRKEALPSYHSSTVKGAEGHSETGAKPRDVVAWVQHLNFNELYTPVILLVSIGLLAFAILASDPLLSSVAITGLALLIAIFLHGTEHDQTQPLKGMRFVALATIAGVCLQVVAILAGEFQITREPLLSRIIVGLMVIGLAALAGSFPFHWWLLELPRRVSPVVAAVLIGAVGIALLAFLLQMLGSYPWLLANQRSETTLMALGVLGLCVAALIALSQEDFTQLLMYTVAGNAGIMLAGIATDSYQGLIGAATLLINQTLSVLLLLLCVSMVARQQGKPTTQLALEDFPFLTRQSPFVALGIAIGSLTLLGVPPFAGFIGRWLIFVEISRQNTYLAVLVIGASILSLLSFVPVFQRLLQGLGIEPNIPLQIPGLETHQRLKPEPVHFRAILLILALFPLITGIYPVPILQAITHVLKGLQIPL